VSLPRAACAKFPAVAILAIESLCKESILAATRSCGFTSLACALAIESSCCFLKATRAVCF